MLEQAFQDVYTKFKLHFYQNIFQRFATREATLTTVESFCMEGCAPPRSISITTTSAIPICTLWWSAQESASPPRTVQSWRRCSPL